MRTLITILLFIVSTQAQTQTQFKKDKQAHLFGGMATASLAMHFGKDIKLHPLIVGVGSSAIAGTAKEILDSKENGNRFDIFDLGYTILGGLISYVLHEIGLSNAVGMGVGITGLGLVFNI